MKKLLACLLAFVMVVLTVPFSAVAAEDDGATIINESKNEPEAVAESAVEASGTWGGIDWTFTADGTLTIAPTKGEPTTDNSGKWTYEVGQWPEAVVYNNKGVAQVEGGEPYADYKNQITKLVIEEGVTSIGSFTGWLPKLTGEVVIPSTVTYIGQDCFNGTPITKLTFAKVPDGQEGKELCIAHGAFKGLKIEEVSLPDDRPVHLHCWTFLNCKQLKHLTLPATVYAMVGSNHIDYLHNPNAQANNGWKGYSQIVGGLNSKDKSVCNPDLETITFGSEEVKELFFSYGDNKVGTVKYGVAYVVSGAVSVDETTERSIVYCTSLQAAANVAQPGDIITLTANTDEVVEIPAGVTLDKGEFTAPCVTVSKPSVAQIGEQGYATLAEALAAAQAGDTITFLVDITEDVTISKKVIIDGAGKTYTGAMTLKADTTIKNVNFDGKGYNGYAITTRGANYLTIEDCTAKNYGYGFVQLASATALTTVKNVTVSNMNYGVKIDYSGAVVFENADITAGVAAVLNSNYGEKTITIKNSKLNILGTWTRNNTIKTNYVFEGANTIDSFIIDAAIDTFKLVTGATLTAPNDITATTDAKGGKVLYENGAYYVKLGLVGSGTEADPYQIGSVDDLILFRDSVNAGETKYNAAGMYFVLTADIDLAGINWVGIGSATADHGFMGNFDGNGYRIKNLTITNPTVDADGYAYAGFFSVTEGTANAENVIKNLIIENVTISTTGDIVAAAIAYPYYTTVENITVCGDINITGGNYTAGALAYTRRCVNASNVTVAGNAGSTITGKVTVGGVISDIQMNGGLTANYSNFSASGITVQGDKSVGGIAGIISKQTLNGATVKDVTLVCDNATVGTVAGSWGDVSTITGVQVENVTGATAVIGATYKDGKNVEAKIGDTYYATYGAALKAAFATAYANNGAKQTVHTADGAVYATLGTWGGIDWTLTADGTLTIAPTEGTPIPDKNAPTKRTYKVGEWRETVIYKSNGSASAVGGAPYDMNAVKKLIIEEGVTSIGSFTCQFPNLTGEVVIPSTVTYIGQEAFHKTPITKLTFAAGGTDGLCIANGAFKKLLITEVSFPGDREYIHIHHWAFGGCTKLETAYIPANVTKCWGGEHVDYFDNFNSQTNVSWTYTSSPFSGCTAMQTITFENETVRDLFFGSNRNSTAEDPMVAYAGLVAYNTFDEALEVALEQGVTLGLAKNVTVKDTIVVPAGKTLTFNLNGKTLSQSKACTKSYEMILNKGTLTITGNGKISFTDTGAGDPNFGWGSYTVRNEGTLVVENGTIEFKGNQAFGTHCSLAIFQYCGSTTINGGTIINNAYRSIRLWKGDMTINGGTFEGQVWVHCVDDSASLTINGGSFKPATGGDASSVFVNNADKKAELSITGGTFATKIGANDVAALAGVITGGSFTEAAKNGTNEALVAGVFAKEADENGYYGIDEAVVSVNGINYATLADALAAAQAGDTITFLADITEDVTISKKVIIDGAGKTYTGAMTLKADTTIKNVNFDGKGYNGYAITTRGANYLTIEDCTAKNYGYGFVQLASATALTTVKNVTVSNMNYGVKIDYSGAVVFENADITAGVAAVLNSNYGEKTITIKNSKLNILGTWTRNNTIKTNYVFEGANTIDSFIIDAAIDTFKLAVGATLTAPNEITVTATEAGYSVKYEDGKYFVKANTVAIGEQSYATLAEALAAAQAGDTITFLADITENVTINKAITIDGADRNYTGTMTINNVTVTIENVNFVKGQVYKNKSTGTTAKITIKNCDFDGQGMNAYAINLGGTSSIVIENVTAKDYGYGLLQVPSSCTGLTVKNVTVSGCYYGLKVDYANAVTIENANIDATIGIYDSNFGTKTYTIKNSAISSLKIWERNTTNYTTFKFEGVNTVATLATSAYAKYTGVQVSDGKFCGTLAEAFAAAQDGDTIKLLSNIAVSEGITNTGKVTLDLNGKTVTGTDNATGSFAIITNKGELTITGNGKIALTATNNRGWNAYSSVISNTVGGKLVVENGTIEHLGGTDMAYAIDNLTNGKGTYAETVINGGTIKSTYRAIRMFLNGVEAENILTVNGGTIEGANKSIWVQDPSKNANTGKITVAAGATLNGDVYLYATAGSAEWPVEVSIAASAVNGEVITGNMPNGYILEKKSGNYTVQKYAAVIGTQYYRTLAEAVEAAKNKSVITLLCDSESAGIVIDKNVTIDFNGFTCTLNGDAAGSANTKTNGFQILKGNAVEFKNGTLKVADEAASKYAMLIQNYANLKIRNMTLDGTNLDYSAKVSYVVSINSGRVYFIGDVEIKSNDRGLANDVAIDVYDYSAAGYDLPMVDIPDTVKIDEYATIADAAKAGKILAAARASKVFYASIQQAIDNSASFSLVGDYVGPGFVIDKQVNINLGGYTLTISLGVGSANTKTNGIQILKGAKVGLSNGKIEAAGNGKLAILIQNYGDLQITNVELDGTNLDYSSKVSYTLSINSGNVKLMGTTNVIANDRNLPGDIAIDVYDYSAAGYERPIVSIYSTVTYTEGKLYAAAKYGNYHYSSLQQCIDNHGSATLVCDFEGPGVVFNKNATINFNGYTYTFTSGVGSTGTESNGFQILKGNRVTLNNGTLKVADSAAAKFYILVQNYGDLTLNSMTLDGTNLDKWSKTDGDSYTLSINSGNVMINNQSKIIANDDGDKAFAFDVCDKSAVGYDLPLVKVAATATIDGNIEAAAKIGNRYYASLAQAIADRDNGSSKDELVLMSNIVLKDTLTIEATKAITLDLNGYTISQVKACTGHYAMIVNKAILTIKDSVGGGKISFTDNGAGDPNFTWGSYTIVNENKLYVNGGTIENLSEQNANGTVKHMYCAIQQNDDKAQLYVNGGTISTPSYRSIRINRGSLTFGTWATTEEGATIEGQVWIQPFADGIKVNVNNGKFSPAGVDSSSIYVDNSSKTVAFRINGGSFETKIGCANADALKGAIRGGSFTEAAIEKTNATLFHKNFVNE